MSVSIQEMIDAGVHFGHQTKFWNPKMKPYIFGARNKIHIINLDQTITLFNNALKFAEQTIKNNGVILFVGTRTHASEIIAEEAKRAGMPYVDHRWLGGMLTNFDTVKKSIKKLETKSALLEKSAENNMSKKELLDLSREIIKLQSSIGGIAEMKGLPAALFIIDTGCHDIAIKEAKKLGIPVIGVVDSNNDPSEVDYIIPGNDDSAKAIRLYVETFANVIIKAKDSVVVDLANKLKVEIVDDNSEAKQKTIHRVKKAVVEAKEEDTDEEIKDDDVVDKVAEPKKVSRVKANDIKENKVKVTTTIAKKEATAATEAKKATSTTKKSAATKIVSKTKKSSSETKEDDDGKASNTNADE